MIFFPFKFRYSNLHQSPFYDGFMMLWLQKMNPYRCPLIRGSTV